jgi:hypothetical protein
LSSRGLLPSCDSGKATVAQQKLREHFYLRRIAMRELPREWNAEAVAQLMGFFYRRHEKR